MKVIDMIGKLDAIGERSDMTAGIDAGDVVRLARGEHLGARHDAALEALAASPAARDAFRLARAIEADALELARGIATARGGNVTALARPVSRPPLRWAVAAAVGFVAVGAALFGWQGTTPEATAPVAATAPTSESDLIFRSSDEGLASTGPRKPVRDDLFIDAFGG